ncbi:hypothetical protein CFter6_0838 [Collimonas fungivorans]|uniref:Uncharacterized protein n=1 Tax=Collimonas fungivorans TaxID=158899 RepID=A0A127P6Y0_9BURK|nr:hypothetical protein CFter6_0838 [Collimonas fungivorans]
MGIIPGSWKILSTPPAERLQEWAARVRMAKNKSLPGKLPGRLLRKRLRYPND